MPFIDLTELQTLTLHVPNTIGVVRARDGKVRLCYGDEWDDAEDVRRKTAVRRKLDEQARKQDT